MELFKDEKYKKLVDKLQEYIKGTAFEGKVYLVGGCVRDAILEEPIKDIDIVVEREGGGIGLATLLAARDKSYKLDSNPVLYPKYGTAKVTLRNDKELSDIDLELVQTRKEQYHEESRNPDQVYGSIEEDAKRRDLTINSLYYNISNKKLYDFNKGIDDLVNQVIKTPTDPDVTFCDDPLRMLRVIRFSCRYGWGIEKNTWMGMVKNAHRIKIISQERITDEISKIITGPNASVGIRKMLYCGLLNRVMPDVYDLTNAYESKNPMLTSFDHTMLVLDKVQPFLEVRLAALFHDVGRIVAEINRGISQDAFSADIASCDLKAMKFPNAIVNSVENSIKYHRFFRNFADGTVPPDKKIRKFINECGDNIGNVVDLMNANNLYQTYDRKKRQVLDILNRIEAMDELEESKNVKLPIDGKEVMKHLGLKKGTPMVGKVMEHLKEAYFENPKITKKECLKLIDEYVKVLTV